MTAPVAPVPPFLADRNVEAEVSNFPQGRGVVLYLTQELRCLTLEDWSQSPSGVLAVYASSEAAMGDLRDKHSLISGGECTICDGAWVLVRQFRHTDQNFLTHLAARVQV